jgi:hypothetical protein
MGKRFLLWLGLTGILWGQNSNYAQYGFGMPSPSFSVRSIALGNTGLAMPDSISLNLLNPALWNGFVTTSIQGQLGSSGLTDEQGATDQFLTQFLGFAFKVPVKKSIGIAIGIAPLTRMVAQKTFVDSTDFGTTPVYYSADVNIKGGISQFFMGGGYRLNPQLCLGFKIMFNFGSYLTKIATDIDYDGSINSYTSKYTDIEGTQLGLGGYWANRRQDLELALYLDWPLRFNTYRIYDFYYGPDSTTAKSRISFPSHLQLGLRKKWHDVLAFSLDFAYSMIPKTMFADFIVFEPIKAQNSSFIGIGIESNRASKSGEPIWRKLILRGGAYYKSGSIYQAGGLTETGVSLGMGIPFHYNLSRVDLAVVSSVRDGFLNDIAGKEKVLSFYVSVTTGELWFRKYRRD